MIRYGILGFGHHGVRRIAPAFGNTQKSSLAGIWGRDLAKASENAQRLKIPHVFTTPEQLCTAPQIDAIFVASPDALHLAHTMLAFRNGKPVLCEKPLAMNGDQAAEMLAAANAAGLDFGVAQNFRYNRSLERMREHIRAGLIGKPVLASAQFCFESDRSPRKWIYDPALACGGPIGDVGVHCIDALRFVLDQDVLSVTTLARHDEQDKQDAQSGGVEATAAIALSLSGGTLASVHVSFRAVYRTLIEITGSTGVLRAESGLTVDRPVVLQHLISGELQSSETLSNADAYSRMLDAFAETIERRVPFASSGADAINNQRTLDAAFLSWRSGQKQPVQASVLHDLGQQQWP